MDHRLTQEEATKTISFLKGEMVALMRTAATRQLDSEKLRAVAQLCFTLAHVVSYIQGNINTPEVIKPAARPSTKPPTSAASNHQPLTTDK